MVDDCCMLFTVHSAGCQHRGLTTPWPLRNSAHCIELTDFFCGLSGVSQSIVSNKEKFDRVRQECGEEGNPTSWRSVCGPILQLSIEPGEKVFPVHWEHLASAKTVWGLWLLRLAPRTGLGFGFVRRGSFGCQSVRKIKNAWRTGGIKRKIMKNNLEWLFYVVHPCARISPDIFQPGAKAHKDSSLVVSWTLYFICCPKWSHEPHSRSSWSFCLFTRWDKWVPQ